MEELIEQVLDVLRNLKSEDAFDVIESLDVDAVIERLPDGAITHNDDALQHLLELSYTLDKYSAGKDYIELRKAHYKNIEWLHNHGLTDMYYDVLFGQIKAEKEAEKDK